MTKEEIKQKIDEAQIVNVYEEKYWRYPKTGDDFKTCPMLKMMFDIEHKGGLIIHIPYPNSKGILDKENGG